MCRKVQGNARARNTDTAPAAASKRYRRFLHARLCRRPRSSAPQPRDRRLPRPRRAAGCPRCMRPTPPRRPAAAPPPAPRPLPAPRRLAAAPAAAGPRQRRRTNCDRLRRPGGTAGRRAHGMHKRVLLLLLLLLPLYTLLAGSGPAAALVARPAGTRRRRPARLCVCRGLRVVLAVPKKGTVCLQAAGPKRAPSKARSILDHHRMP